MLKLHFHFQIWNIKYGRSTLSSSDVRIVSIFLKRKIEIFKSDETLKNTTCIWYNLYVFSPFLPIILCASRCNPLQKALK